jgi:hypothetical protein
MDVMLGTGMEIHIHVGWMHSVHSIVHCIKYARDVHHPANFSKYVEIQERLGVFRRVPDAMAVDCHLANINAYAQKYIW